ncbi:PEPxxWA-CTERM sorting domain-containing protein [Phenylobacterium sp.]|uniref:PEPxxWA-CTERM sorting domain-containing protein n=1 Tax=Phenylobacterium sp. TaxID=1871053 RepID=UPI0025D9A590|nr:PEPxxWA-CTERM sorting domain-containing protein [Phenylobacterium sp.]
MRPGLFTAIAAFISLSAAPSVAAQYIFTTVDFAGADFGTFLYGLNDAGAAVGTAQFKDGSQGNRSFVYESGAFSTVDIPGSSPSATVAYSLNNDGYTAGGYQDFPSTGVRGFIETGSGFQSVDVPGANPTEVHRVNNLGDAVGSYTAPGSIARSFLLSGGTLSYIDVPWDSDYTDAWDINDGGDIVGSYGVDGVSHGFLLSGGAFTMIDVPGALRTSVMGINNAGAIAGHYTSATGVHGFVFENGVYTTIDHPLADSLTFVMDINNDGSLVGFFNTAGGYSEYTHGFIADVGVPEPATWALLLVGFGLGGASLRQRRRAASI